MPQIMVAAPEVVDTTYLDIPLMDADLPSNFELEVWNKLGTRDLKLGDKGEDVDLLHSALWPTYTPPLGSSESWPFNLEKKNQEYGPATQQAVAKFQNDINDNGELGVATKELIKKLKAKHNIVGGTLFSVASYKTKNFILNNTITSGLIASILAYYIYKIYTSKRG